VFAIGATIIAILAVATAIATWLALREARANRVSQQIIAFLQDDFLFNPRDGPTPAGIDPVIALFPSDLKLTTMLGYATSNLRERFVEQPEVERSIRATIGFTYELLGEEASALVQWNRVLIIAEEQYGWTDDRTLVALRAIVRLLCKQQEYSKAESVGEPALDLHKMTLGDTDVRTLMLSATLGVSYFSSGKVAEAENLLGLVVRHRQILGTQRSQVRVSMSVLAEIYLQRGELRNAEKLALDVLSRYMSEDGWVTYDMIPALHRLRRIYLAMGRDEEAASLFAEAQACEQCLAARRCAPRCRPWPLPKTATRETQRDPGLR
jgi:tetratricopeptide (TPR) repeat protein